MGDSSFDIDLNAVRAFLATKEERRRVALDLRFERARTDFDAIVERIVARHSPRRVYQWGSLLDRNKFSELSDIDVAVEGLDGPEEFFALLGDVMQISEFPLDIVELEKVGSENADYIRKTGRLVYERSSER
ncbi:MAG: nucleotidyltransferase domain-containing protein [Rectinemataceae bacterium]|jgi:predicted nucleotidyltransferase